MEDLIDLEGHGLTGPHVRDIAELASLKSRIYVSQADHDKYVGFGKGYIRSLGNMAGSH